MKKRYDLKWKIPASLALASLLALTNSASAALTVATTNQFGGAPVGPFAPTWSVVTNNSLIYGLVPSATAGNFSLETQGGTRNVNTLTVNDNLTLTNFNNATAGTTNYVTCGNGSGAGSLLVYTLPAGPVNGYNLTNITVYGGWANSGRDAQAYTVLYSTVADPNSFNYLTSVNFNPAGVPANTPSANRVTIADSVGGTIAANVVAIKFVFNVPTVENGYSGYAAITVGGTAAGSVAAPVVSVTTSNQSGANPYTPTWALETPSLIAGLAPTTANGNFTLEGSGGTPVLTDGVSGVSGIIGGFATCGAGGGSGNTLIYTLTNTVNGSDVTNIVVYSGWGDGGRHGQYYNLSYSTVSAPSTYVPITTVYYLPSVTGAPANRVAIAMNNGTPLASGVANIKFDFSGPPSAGNFNNGYQGYSEIIVQGGDTAAPPPPPSPYLTQDTLPASAATVVGDQVIMTAAYSNVPPATLQWQVVSGGVTNDILGATSATLTLNNVQLADSGSYRLKAVNATNGAAAPSYSSGSVLTVSSVPAPVNNIITAYAAQTGLGNASSDTNFYPTWIVAGNSMIAGAIPAAGLGDFGRDQTAGDPAILTDGTFGYLNTWPGVGGSPSLVTCGVNPAGQSVTYTFDTSISGSTNGYDLTNIVVYGGWGDAGRDQQKYQILYATVADPSTFNQLVTVDYNPANPLAAQSATRATVLAATGSLVQNVAAVMFNFNLVGAPPENGYEGYSELIVSGVASAPKPVLSQDIRPLTAADVVGSQLVISAAFTSATPVTYQWKKDGVNIPGATTPTLTLNNLQFTDTATNGGYSLYASNSSGFAFSRGCAVTVNPVPTATNNVVTAFAYQTSDAGSFSPSWSVVSGSLIANQSPTSQGAGNFNDPDLNPASNGQAGGIPVLTDENYGSVINGGPHPAFATAGSGAGQFVVYTLTGAANGYDLTNIVIAGGWNDSGRDHQAYTVAYSTAANPTTFIPLAVVNNNPVLEINANKTVIRTTLTPVSGSFATNVFAVLVDFTAPGGENGYSGYSEISLYGSASAAPLPPGPVVTVENQNTDTPTWILETGNLIAGQLPSSVGLGDFQAEASGGTVVLTDGSISPLTGVLPFATAGNAAGQSVTYTSAYGWNLTNIVVYSGWGNFDRDGQFYDISYSTVANPGTFLPLVSVDYNPANLGGPAANRVAITNSTGGSLATSVAAIKFDFTRQAGRDNGYSGYAEIVLQGTELIHFNPPFVSGGNLIITGAGTPGQSYALLTSTDVAAPLATWTTNLTGVANGSGVISNAIPVSTSEPARYFRLKTP